MNPYRLQQLVESVKTDTGWVYHEMPWISAEEAPRLEQVRRGLLERLGEALSYSFSGTKPHIGALSPGCRLCGTPDSVFHFINRPCTRKCRFCPQDRSTDREMPPWTDGMWFENDGDFVLFLEAFGIRGVGFSGGEPLLALDKLVSRIRAVRRSRCRDAHLWLYTNGDLLDRDSLEKLGSAGLDEIRINISARSYDLSPVRLARVRIPVVTVEIPALPGDADQVKKAMVDLDALGADHLNLIQLEISRDNYRSLDLGAFHVSHRTELLPVFESELCSLEMMLFRQERGLRLPVLSYPC
jgi:pyruvate formate-lyase activating enzyme-like uncharacterized protein